MIQIGRHITVNLPPFLEEREERGDAVVRGGRVSTSSRNLRRWSSSGLLDLRDISNQKTRRWPTEFPASSALIGASPDPPPPFYKIAEPVPKIPRWQGKQMSS
ncbi:hypothetical protein U1Q18_046403 [Sarracenia purpurea var. burkii]